MANFNILFAMLPCNKGFAFDRKLKEIGFIEDDESNEKSECADKDAEFRGLRQWQRTIGYINKEKKITAKINMEKNGGWVQPTYMELFDLYNFTEQEAEEILAILKSIHPEIKGKIIESRNL